MFYNYFKIIFPSSYAKIISTQTLKTHSPGVEFLFLPTSSLAVPAPQGLRLLEAELVHPLRPQWPWVWQLLSLHLWTYHLWEATEDCLTDKSLGTRTINRFQRTPLLSHEIISPPLLPVLCKMNLYGALLKSNNGFHCPHNNRPCLTAPAIRDSLQPLDFRLRTSQELCLQHLLVRFLVPTHPLNLSLNSVVVGRGENRQSTSRKVGQLSCRTLLQKPEWLLV